MAVGAGATWTIPWTFEGLAYDSPPHSRVHPWVGVTCGPRGVSTLCGAAIVVILP